MKDKKRYEIGDVFTDEESGATLECVKDYHGDCGTPKCYFLHSGRCANYYCKGFCFNLRKEEMEDVPGVHKAGHYSIG